MTGGRIVTVTTAGGGFDGRYLPLAVAARVAVVSYFAGLAIGAVGMAWWLS